MNDRALHASLCRLRDLLELGEIRDVEHEVEAFAARADELGTPYYAVYAVMFRAAMALLASAR